jgi:branched-chain amino acid transport system ATP-binding protein
MLEINRITVRYGMIEALHDLSITVGRGQIVTLIGANGAGKTTALKTISGLLRASSGSISFQGTDITRMRPHRIVGLGISHVPEGRLVFANLSVLDNLKMGAYLQKDSSWIRRELDHVFGLFPRLQERVAQRAGTLSGGEQQMLAIGRALMSKPSLLMLDEPSLGIAPLLVKTIFDKIVEINRTLGMTIILVEQNANLALQVAHAGFVLETGRMLVHDTAAALKSDPLVKKAYLGLH